MRTREQGRSGQKGLVLITSLLLLLIITIIAVSMFRSFGVQEQIAGNIREKQRATHAADAALQYAEWWLTDGSNAANPATNCTTVLNANLNEGQICSNTFESAGVNPASPSWQSGGWAMGDNTVGVQYTPPGMVTTGPTNATPSPGTYLQSPSFYIAYLGVCADGVGSCYQIDAVGYGGTDSAVSVVESTYEISSGITNRGGL